LSPKRRRQSDNESPTIQRCWASKVAAVKNWTQGHCELDGMRLRYFRSGGAFPPLVLVHGFTDNALYYSRVAAVLAQTWDVIAYDCRGHGESSRAGGHFENADRVRDLLGVVDQLGLVRPGLMGHSMGAATVANAVAHRPGLARAIVLEDPAWWEAPAAATPDEAAELEKARLARNGAWRDSIAAVQAGTWEEGLVWRRSDAPLWTDDDIALSLVSRYEVELDLFTYFPMARSPWREVVKTLDCPTLLVIGERERGGIISVDDATEAAVSNRLVQWIQVAGAGHAIRYDQFDAFSAAVVNFLEGVSAG
jgi:N-formylmaleamate deformylase